MRLGYLGLATLLWSFASATILQNGQVKEDPYPGQAPQIALDNSWANYDAGAPELAYKGRWDSKHVSWWSAPGLKLEFTGDKLAVSFGPLTSDGVLIAYRLGSLDWQYSNVTADSTYQFIGPWTELAPELVDIKKSFELRVQIAGASVASNAVLAIPPRFEKKVEIIGASLATGQFASYETLSSWAYLFVAGLGDAEHTITAYPGVCMVDNQCYGGGAHGMTWYWHRASDPGTRSREHYPDHSMEIWDNKSEQPADLVVIQLGGNDHRHPNEIPPENFYHAYIELIEDIHATWPNARVIIMGQWGVWEQKGLAYEATQVYEEEAQKVQEHFKDQGFVYYFSTRGVLQHNDINPMNHCTDVGHVKLASHLLEWTRLVMGWHPDPKGEVQHGTMFWNDMQQY